MAGAYAKEFEKWLKQGTAVDDNSVDMEDSGDEVDDYQMESKETTEGKIPVFKNYSSNTFNKNGQNYLLDEPPILEPVLHSLDMKVSVSGSETKVQREYDILDKNPNSVFSQCHTESDEVEILNRNGSNFSESEKSSFNKMKDSENIFDKFGVLSEGDDFPPPLIPSHEAHLTTVDAKDDDSLTEKSYTTLQNLSPNFCAMEADSTSEMLNTDPQNTSVTLKDRTSKFIIGKEIAVECDSTCMLGSSPNVVSPDSVSNIESDNLLQTPSQDESIFSEENSTFNWSSMETQERFSLSQQSENQKIHPSLNNDYVMNKMMLGSDLQDSMWDRECPKLEAVTDVTEGKDIYQCKRSNDVEDPPVLSVISQTLKSPSISSRKKRHTIDTIQSVKKRKQKSHCREFVSKKSKCIRPAGQQLDSYISTDNAESLSKRVEKSFPPVKTEDNSSQLHSSHHSHPRKRRHKRCQTLPIVDLISYGGHLPRDLYRFVVDSSQLSDLQNRMHRLLSLLFPQLSAEISVMSPESSRFEALLSDLFLSLQEYESGADGKACEAISTSHSSSHIEQNRLKWEVVKSDATHTLSKMTSNPSGFLLPSCASSHTQTNSTLDPQSQSCVNKSAENDSHKQSEFVPFADNSPDQHSTSKCNLPNAGNEQWFSPTESVIPGFSELSVENKEKVLQRQPSVVIHKNPSAVYKNLVHMCCSILQSLLPDLDISLSKEFVDSPQDLLSFIDSVIALN